MPLNRICGVDVWNAALGTFARRATKFYPECPLDLDGDLLSADTLKNWSHAEVVERLERDGIPIIFCGWPCVGWAGARRQGHDEEHFDNPSSALLLPVTRILNIVVAWLDTH